MSRYPGFQSGAGWADEWGYHPDVARFIGGPRDGEFENIGTSSVIAMQDVVDDVYTWGSVNPIRLTQRVTYVRGTVSVGPAVLTVMYPQGYDISHVQRRAQDAWVMQWDPWATAPVPFRSVLWWTDRDPGKTPEQATEWLFNGTGKEFL